MELPKGTTEPDHSRIYILRPKHDRFKPGETHVLLILRGTQALREAQIALRTGTWRGKYKESQMYRLLE